MLPENLPHRYWKQLAPSLIWVHTQMEKSSYRFYGVSRALIRLSSTSTSTFRVRVHRQERWPSIWDGVRKSFIIYLGLALCTEILKFWVVSPKNVWSPKIFRPISGVSAYISSLRWVHPLPPKKTTETYSKLPMLVHEMIGPHIVSNTSAGCDEANRVNTRLRGKYQHPPSWSS